MRSGRWSLGALDRGAGAARVTVDDLVDIVHENESIYIPMGATHRLEIPGRIPPELIEVQTGSYLGEATPYGSRMITGGLALAVTV